ncbi:MAG: BACON domain-containing protein [Bacteroidales bacterium]|nr:BACON domain-containing protein [Bacteroidales bacterium]
MKLRYILSAFALASVLFASCEQKLSTDLDGLTADKTYVSIPEEGGSVSIQLTSDEAWSMESPTVKQKDGKDDKTGKDLMKDVPQLEAEINKWVSVSPTTGKPGETKITFSAPKSEVTSHKSELVIRSGEKELHVIVRQQVGPEVAETQTVKAVDNAFTVGKTYRVRGKCASITNTTYGNWMIEDLDNPGTQLTVYGTNNWSGSGIEVNDIVTVEGPATLYGSTKELENVDVIEVEKALIVADKATVAISKDEKPFQLLFTVKGAGVEFESKADWLDLGTGFTVNDKGKTVFTVTAKPNDSGARREGKLWFKSTQYDKEKKTTASTEAEVLIVQLAEPGGNGTLASLTADALAKKKSFDVVIDEKKPISVVYINGSNFFLDDGESGMLLYSSSASFKVGEKISGRIYGKLSVYNSAAQMTELSTLLTKVTDAPLDPAKLPKPVELTFEELNANFSKYLNRVIVVKNLDVTSAVNVTYNTPSSSPAFTSGKVKYGSVEFPVFVKATKWFQMEVGKKYDLTCTPVINKGANSLAVWDPGHIVELKAK